jgi:hypothetical protein
MNGLLGLPNANPGAFASAIVTAAFGLVLLLISGFMATQKSTRSAA